MIEAKERAYKINNEITDVLLYHCTKLVEKQRFLLTVNCGYTSREAFKMLYWYMIGYVEAKYTNYDQQIVINYVVSTIKNFTNNAKDFPI